MLRDGAGERIEFDTPADASRDVKHVATVVDADLVGIAPFDDRWVYTERFSVTSGGAEPNDLPDGPTSVIVIGQSMDHDLTRTAPSALAGTATGRGRHGSPSASRTAPHGRRLLPKHWWPERAVDQD